MNYFVEKLIEIRYATEDDFVIEDEEKAPSTPRH